MAQSKIRGFWKWNKTKRNETNSALTLFDLLKFRTEVKSLYTTSSLSCSVSWEDTFLLCQCLIFTSVTSHSVILFHLNTFSELFIISLFLDHLCCGRIFPGENSNRSLTRFHLMFSFDPTIWYNHSFHLTSHQGIFTFQAEDHKPCWYQRQVWTQKCGDFFISLSQHIV